jgi:hypothetical protein
MCKVYLLSFEKVNVLSGTVTPSPLLPRLAGDARRYLTDWKRHTERTPAELEQLREEELLVSDK